MQQVTCFVLALFGCFLCTTCHPTRPDIPEDPRVKLIFQNALKANSGGFLTKSGMMGIFSRFDMNSDGTVDEMEFLAHWTLLNMGDLEHAITMFKREDTDNDGVISMKPDFGRIFFYFDRDGDGKISEEEFMSVWFNLSS